METSLEVTIITSDQQEHKLQLPPDLSVAKAIESVVTQLGLEPGEYCLIHGVTNKAMADIATLEKITPLPPLRLALRDRPVTCPNCHSANIDLQLTKLRKKQARQYWVKMLLALFVLGYLGGCNLLVSILEILQEGQINLLYFWLFVGLPLSVLAMRSFIRITADRLEAYQCMDCGHTWQPQCLVCNESETSSIVTRFNPAQREAGDLFDTITVTAVVIVACFLFVPGISYLVVYLLQGTKTLVDLIWGLTALSIGGMLAFLLVNFTWASAFAAVIHLFRSIKAMQVKCDKCKFEWLVLQAEGKVTELRAVAGVGAGALTSVFSKFGRAEAASDPTEAKEE